MAITFDLARLTSRAVRSQVGPRTIRGMEQSSGGSSSGGGGVLGAISWVFNAAWSLTGFLVGKVLSYFTFSWSGFWGWITSTAQYLWNFNWNSTDAQLDASIRSQWKALAAQVGGTLGNAFGYIACGILPGAVIFAFNEPLGAYVLQQVAAEGLEEFLENLGSLFNSALRLSTQIIITETFKSVRKLIKSNSKLVSKLLGKNAEKAVKAWGSEGSQAWSFAKATEDSLDNTFGTDSWQRELAEEFLEEAAEGCIEAGYVVANAVDTFLSAEMLSRTQIPPLGAVRYVEITPNRDNPEERIVLGGSEELLKPQIIEYLSTYEQLNGKDLGVIYGTPAADMPERSHRPEVVLKFYQKQNSDIKKGAITDSVEMRISFRLMNKSTPDFATTAYAKTLAESIYREFATPVFKINKGTKIFTYSDFEKGYQFILRIDSEIEAKKVIKKVLDIQNHAFSDEGFRKGSTPVDNPTGTKKGEKITILGESVRLPVSNKTGIVAFTGAYINLGVRVPPINLVDLTGRRKDVVYKPATK